MMASSTEQSIFLQLLDAESADARRAMLAQLCGDDEAMRASLERLLSAHELPDNPLDQPAAALRSVPPELLDATLLRDHVASSEGPGTVIGPYRLMEQIGEGGFGLVFVAEQLEPVRRRVALKLIKPGMDSRDVIARFEAERQALALMDHPNIAKVLDAGTTSAGRPYFVMELVRGVPITQFCDEQAVDLRARLELFVTVCQAVQHAHQKGVIHRDIKPSNVLVTLHDETPVVKVIDFGIAKAIGQNLTDKTIYTRFAAMIGTPLYMSPEQAAMSGLDVDTRSDIYSLGVLLYELLTGTTPFDRDRFSTADFDEVRRIIREEDPPKPSTRLTTLCGGKVSTLQSTRRLGLPRPSTSVPGDLDWIVMKAMEKDRRRRYESAGSLAGDVRRFLGAEPVEARPPSRLYQLARFAQRNRVTLVTASLVAISLLIGTGVSVWQAARAVSERNEKQAALQRALDARNEADAARKQVEEFAERLKEASSLVTSGRALADAGRWAAAYQDYSRAIERQPKYYNAWIERASLEVRLGLWKQAAEDYSKALELGVPPDNPANWGIPQLFLFNGDEASYREYCREMLERAQRGGHEISFAVLRSCELTPSAVTDPASLAALAEKMVKEIPRFPPLAGEPRQPPMRDSIFPPAANLPFEGPMRPEPNWRGPRDDPRRRNGMPGGRGRPNDFRFPAPFGAMHYVAGLAQYRAGDYDKAADHLKRAADDRGWSSHDMVHPVLAMTHHRLGHAEDAKRSFEAASQAIERWTDGMAQQSVGTMPVPWFDWIESKVLYREAAILLTGFAPADDPKLREMERRALAAIQSEQTDEGVRE